MAAAQTHITPTTPMGATPVDGGATFRVWARPVRWRSAGLTIPANGLLVVARD
jgi:hypothetical protein